MAWNKDAIQSSTKIRNYPSLLTDNFTAIQTGDSTSATPTLSLDVANLAHQAATPTLPTSATGRLYASTVSSETELFFRNENATPIQLTDISKTVKANPCSIYLPGGMVLKAGNENITPTGSPARTYTVTFAEAFTTLYSFQVTPENASLGIVWIPMIVAKSASAVSFYLYPRGTATANTTPQNVHWLAIGEA